MRGLGVFFRTPAAAIAGEGEFLLGRNTLPDFFLDFTIFASSPPRRQFAQRLKLEQLLQFYCFFLQIPGSIGLSVYHRGAPRGFAAVVPCRPCY